MERCSEMFGLRIHAVWAEVCKMQNYTQEAGLLLCRNRSNMLFPCQPQGARS
jgi:hypothetical protein